MLIILTLTPRPSNTMQSGGTKNHASFISLLRLEHLAGGVVGGVVSSLVTHPFDLVKLRLAVHDGQATAARPKYRNMIHAFLSVAREGGVRRLYRGASANVAGSGLSWGLYFFYYNAMKFYLQNGNVNHPLPATTHLMCGMCAGALTLSVSNPIWVVKTRMCLASSGTVPGHMQYHGLRHGLRNLWRHEGIRGMYSGFLPGLVGTSHGAVQFMVYEELKKRYSLHYDQPLATKLSPLHYIVMAASSKGVAVSVTYPYQVVRARLQDQEKLYSGVKDVVLRIARFEGVRGFYKGLSPSIVKVVPATCITFLVYEYVSDALTRMR